MIYNGFEKNGAFPYYSERRPLKGVVEKWIPSIKIF